MKKNWGQIYTCWCYRSKFGRKKIKAMKEINNEQLGWLEITYLSNKLRICRGDKGTLFVFRKINSLLCSRILRIY